MKFSCFGQRFTRPAGAVELMTDLGAAMAAAVPPLMLGGGNPAHIPEMLAVFRERFHAVLDDDRDFRRLVADYPDPLGEQTFRSALAGLLRRECGWDVGPENIALTAGSQQGFFLLFNLLAGPSAAGGEQRILLPLTPEYIGYGDLGVTQDLFVAQRPVIEHLPERLFKYHVDFAALDGTSDLPGTVAAICASRPTNPTGNVLTDDEVHRLRALARRLEVPLILDSAYGLPFPQIVFTAATPIWDENVIVCMSLSKLGLPGLRTGMVIARPEIITALGAMTAVTSLAVGSVGPVLVRDLVASGEIVRLSREVIRPFYQRRALQALAWLREALDGCDWHVHTPEGALFLWLWLPRLSITSAELYARLKARGVLVLSGHHFFPGLSEPPEAHWPHRDQCLRITYARDEETVRRGIAILGDEARRWQH
ncbi:MAG: valine--pyruvate transaminase [Gammaproteobacteria bacterium]|nr:valine--pyruvate transaminase [Gammaproteobacteria bacterium]